MILNLKDGLGETLQYKAWKFPGGEIHFKLSSKVITLMGAVSGQSTVYIQTRLNTSDDIILLCLAVDTIKKNWRKKTISVYIPYMPYAQADMDFGPGESFSLSTITTILKALPIDEYVLYDPHSTVSAALLMKENTNIVSKDNSHFIDSVLEEIDNTITIISPDAGAFKKIFKLCEKIGFEGPIEGANKYRDITNGEIQIRLSNNDFKGSDVLIIDDICVGGRTFIELAKLLQNRNAGNIYLAISHGVFSNGFDELSKYFKGVFTTNSRRDYTADERPEFLTIINII